MLGNGPFWYRARLIKGGPFVPVKVWCGGPLVDGEELDRSWRWQCVVRLETTARAILQGDWLPVEVEDALLLNIETITAQEYAYMVDHTQWAVNHQPDHPEASPRRKLDKRGKSIW